MEIVEINIAHRSIPLCGAVIVLTFTLTPSKTDNNILWRACVITLIEAYPRDYPAASQGAEPTCSLIFPRQLPALTGRYDRCCSPPAASSLMVLVSSQSLSLGLDADRC